ncbi:MAG: NAD(P)H-dependent glycerol-3-phosphate dehydrogenase [candidate division Zixibacteria bacterium]|nr:NAD(P)H-dependent glycerol-3-phosphate dehydrogenase [candidate division Zixibacteria bacterium]
MSDVIDRARIAILGAGGWGMAMANLLTQGGHDTILWEYDPKEADQLSQSRALPTKLPGIELPQSIEVTNNLPGAIDNANVVVFATPSTAVRPTAVTLSGVLPTECLIVSLAKGIDIETGERMTEIINSTLNRTDAVALLGPSHAEEVARGIPTAVVAASTDHAAAERTQHIFSSEQFRVYTSDDPVGVELGAALKNIVAIAAGIVDGIGLDSSDNMKGALLTRGLAEITRLGVAMGANPETFAGLSGVGDLVTTCLSQHSRNRHVGEQIGRGRSLEDILAEMSMVAEGVNATRAALRMARQHDVDMPIAEAVHAMLFEGIPAKIALNALMTRPLTSEIRR